MKQNKEVGMEQLYIILPIFVDLQPVYLFSFYLHFEQGECLQIGYANCEMILILYSVN